MERRNFLKNTLAGTAAIGVSSFVTGGLSEVFGQQAPINKVRVALIGCRNQGWGDLDAFLQYPEVECVSLCDIDDEWLNKRADDVEKKTGKKPPQLVKDWRRVMDNKDVDVVIVATPDHWHCLLTIVGCESGKDVYVEKPLAPTIEEANLMVKAVKKYNRVVQVGQWQRSDPHWDEVAAFVQSGKLGRIRTVKGWVYQNSKMTIPVVPDSSIPAGVDYDMWLGPTPKRPFNANRFHYHFRYFWDYSSGLTGDWGCHLLDYALKAMNVGLPSYVYGCGGKYGYPNDAMEAPDTLTATFQYSDFNIVWEHACGLSAGQFNRTDGVAFIGENGNLIVDRNGWEVRPERNTRGRLFPFCYICDPAPGQATSRMDAVEFKKGEGKGLYNHVGNFLECIKSRKQPNAHISVGAEVVKLAHLANISYRLGVGLQWNDKTNTFMGNREANNLIKANYRAPWKLPKV